MFCCLSLADDATVYQRRQAGEIMSQHKQRKGGRQWRGKKRYNIRKHEGGGLG